jgi:RNA polymerase sigma factor (sigma-70 family)
MAAAWAPVVAERRTLPCLAAPYSRKHVIPTTQPAEEDAALLRVRERALRYARSRVPVEAAEDLVQETLVLLLTKYDEVRAPEEQVCLAIGIVSKKIAGHWRRSNRRGEATAVDVADAGLEDGLPDPEEQLERQQRFERLRFAVGRLTGRLREVARLRLEDRTSPEIAEILSANLNTVYSWDHRLVKKLRELMGAPEVKR